MKIEDKINYELNKIRPYIQADGGDIKFVKYEDGKVYVEMIGACAGCNMVDYTIKEDIETLLVNEIAEVKEVINITSI